MSQSLARAARAAVFAAVGLAAAGVAALAQNKLPPLDIPSAFPFQAHYVEVLGHSMHYVDTGEGGGPVSFVMNLHPESDG